MNWLFSQLSAVPLLVWLLILAGGLAVGRGILPRHSGTRPTAWWRTQRESRTAAQVVVRLLRVLLAGGLLVAACVMGTAMVVAVVVAGLLLAVLALAWFGLRRAASAVEPVMTPMEREDFHGTCDDFGGPPSSVVHPLPAIEPVRRMEII